MSFGEFIADTLFQIVGEIILYPLLYFAGYLFLSVLFLGQLKLAPLSALHEKNKRESKWYQIKQNIWLQRGHQKLLRAEIVCLAGSVVWIALGLGVLFLWAS